MSLLRAKIFMACAVIWFMTGILLGGGEGMHIEQLKVPDSVRNGSSKTVLDCVYTLNESEKEGLVVKWYLNDQSTLVYQWILNQKPQDLGKLKGKLNLDHKASDDPHMAHRALEIINPTPDLSGVYYCAVSSFGSDVTKSKKMIVYVPQKNMKFNQDKVGEDKVTAKCSAEGLFPEPNMTITSSDKTITGVTEVNVIPKNELFDITATITVDANVDASTTFECTLRIPDTDYVETRSLNFAPVRPRRTSTTGRPVKYGEMWVLSGVEETQTKYFADANLFSAADNNSGNRPRLGHAYAAAFAAALVSLISARL